MKTTYVVSGHVDSRGNVVGDQPIPAPPGPVDLTVATRADKARTASLEKRRKLMLKLLRAAHAVKCPSVPKDGKSIDEVLYGR